jgi:hypothetical protein
MFSTMSGWRIVLGSKGEALSHIWSLPFASRLAALLKLDARYSAENTKLAPEGEPVVACRPIKSHRYPLTLATGIFRALSRGVFD